MSDPVFVGPANLATVKPEDVADLIEDFRDAGFDARLAHDNAVGAGPEVFDTVVVWVAESAGEAAIGVAVTLGVQWMRKRFQFSPRKKSVYIYRYKNDTGETVKIIEMSSPDEEPEVRELHEFERHTQTIPPERSPEVAQRPWWRRVFGG